MSTYSLRDILDPCFSKPRLHLPVAELLGELAKCRFPELLPQSI